MKGLELNRAYYLEYGAKMIDSEFADVKNLLAVGSVGSGSENFGYDDDVSRDHDFEPGFCIFLPKGFDERRAFALERAYAKLPKEFMGVTRQKISPVGGARHGVMYTGDFYRARCGSGSGEMSVEQWFSVPDFYLAEATNGEIYFDALGEFTAARNRLLDMPEDVFLKKLAGNLLMMKQAGQYNYPRILSHGERASAQLAAFRFVEATINVVFLLNRKYKPFYKWIFKALAVLKEFSHLSTELEFLLSTENDDKTASIKTALIENVCAEIAEYLKDNELSKATCNDLEKHAYSVNDKIVDPSIRNANILTAI